MTRRSIRMAGCQAQLVSPDPAQRWPQHAAVQTPHEAVWKRLLYLQAVLEGVCAAVRLRGLLAGRLGHIRCNLGPRLAGRPASHRIPRPSL